MNQLPQKTFDEYRDFFQKMLKIAKINQKYADLFTDEAGMKIFLKVVTHPTFDAVNNYQELEFVGDGILKGILSQYILRRFPNYRDIDFSSKKGTSEGLLSKIRRTIEKKETLSNFALNLGFWDFVIANDEVKTGLRKETLEDVFEAFIGAIVEIVDTRLKEGLGYYYAYNFVKHSLDKFNISTEASDLDDSVTILNELYKTSFMENGKPPLKWGDAVYIERKLYVPKVDSLPAINTTVDGDVVYNIKDKSPYIATRKGWVKPENAPLVEFKAPPNVPEDQGQTLWYIRVYGFLNAKTPILVNNTNIQLIKENPSAYGANAIGQGLYYLKQTAKKNAASAALKYLYKLGYKKAKSTAITN